MNTALYKNATDCGETLAFKDSEGRIFQVRKSDLNPEIEAIYSNPEVLAVMKDSVDDYLDGRFTDFEA